MPPKVVNTKFEFNLMGFWSEGK